MSKTAEEILNRYARRTGAMDTVYKHDAIKAMQTYAQQQVVDLLEWIEKEGYYQDGLYGWFDQSGFICSTSTELYSLFLTQQNQK